MKLDNVQATVTDHRHSLTSLEANINQLRDKVEALGVKYAALEDSYNSYKG